MHRKRETEEPPLSGSGDNRSGWKESLSGRRYEKALSGYVRGGDEASLHAAYELGREALEREVGLLDFVNLHREQLEALLQDVRPAELAGLHLAGGRFLVEGLGPFAIMQAHRAEANKAVRRLNHFLEEEGRRIAQSLHDASARLLVAAYMELAGIERERPTLPVSRRVEAARRDLDQVQEQLRRISHELNPPVLERLGLIEALNYLADGISERNGLAVHVRCQCDPRRRFAPALEMAVYRGVREALDNVVRHAGARKVTVTLGVELNALICSIEDDGAGFGYSTLEAAIAAGGLGLAGVRARIEGVYGSLRIVSPPEGGTMLRIVIPLAEDHTASLRR